MQVPRPPRPRPLSSSSSTSDSARSSSPRRPRSERGSSTRVSTTSGRRCLGYGPWHWTRRRRPRRRQWSTRRTLAAAAAAAAATAAATVLKATAALLTTTAAAVGCSRRWVSSWGEGAGTGGTAREPASGVTGKSLCGIKSLLFVCLWSCVCPFTVAPDQIVRAASGSPPPSPLVPQVRSTMLLAALIWTQHAVLQLTPGEGSPRQERRQPLVESGQRRGERYAESEGT